MKLVVSGCLLRSLCTRAYQGHAFEALVACFVEGYVEDDITRRETLLVLELHQLAIVAVLSKLVQIRGRQIDLSDKIVVVCAPVVIAHHYLERYRLFRVGAGAGVG